MTCCHVVEVTLSEESKFSLGPGSNWAQRPNGGWDPFGLNDPLGPGTQLAPFGPGSIRAHYCPDLIWRYSEDVHAMCQYVHASLSNLLAGMAMLFCVDCVHPAIYVVCYNIPKPWRNFN